MELKKENKDHCKVSFLHLSTEFYDRKFTAKLFDERNTFPFYINRMTDSECNIPSKVFYASTDSDILRFARTKADLINIVTSLNLLLIQMIKQGGKCVRIISYHFF